MRFSPNPNNLRPKHYENDVLMDEHVLMYEYINPKEHQKPYFIIHNPIGIELDCLKSILDILLHTQDYIINYETYDDIMHVVINGIYFKDGIIAQQFHDNVMNYVPDKISSSFIDLRPNARLHPRYVRLLSLDTSITNIKIEDIEYSSNPLGNDTWYKALIDYLWLIPSYLIPTLNNQSNP